MKRIDIAWANAAAPCEGKATEINVDQWQRAIDVNLTGSWFTARFALPHMIKAAKGSLVFTGSGCSTRGVPRTFAYAVAKAGINGLARQIADDYAEFNIRANVILPGTTLTPMVADVYATRSAERGLSTEELMRDMAVGYPFRRSGTPMDQANAALFFSADESDWVTGHVFSVDGGRFASW